MENKSAKDGRDFHPTTNLQIPPFSRWDVRVGREEEGGRCVTILEAEKGESPNPQSDDNDD